MQIVADESIPYVREAFGSFGTIRLVSGREIAPAHVRDADILLTRSVTRVNAELLGASQVRFVGSATIGVDHIDLPYLRSRGIVFAYAPGSNANSVAEYVIAAILALEQKSFARRTVGIIGLGRIGTLVKAKAEALGMAVLANDPPLERAGRSGLISLTKLLSLSDIVSCHVPLSTEEPDATFHLLDRVKLSLMRPDAVLINTARGPVVDNRALLSVLQKDRLGAAVLDVWEGEPEPDPRLLAAVTVGTPHIAGYSFDGKLNGTKLLYESVCAFLKYPQQWNPPALSSGVAPVRIDPTRPLDDFIAPLVARSYDIRRDDAALRALAKFSTPERGHAFDRLRATYPRRLEFVHTTVVVPAGRAEIRQALSTIGFAVQGAII
jgi:erythronate-4-phosphate dehydrogenase